MNQIITLGPEDDLNTITTSGFYRLNGVEINVPSGCGWGTLSVTGDQNTALQIVSDHINKQFWKRTYRNSSIWSEWIPIPAATPPQEYELPLSGGLQHSSRSVYSKNQFGQVHVHGAVSAGDGTIGWDQAIATLPEGYRPSASMEFCASFVADGINCAGAVSISTDGLIKAYPNVATPQKVVYFDLFFLAPGLG
ncbi:pyocin knob domain-containing protein [Pseudoflavonifractor phocaeensis]|uniref:pyocin knob domain-containing protein n=1 Tax=Pseudoflavonifractor phocaeensis TaxID=1870988 RepID=UPI00195CBF83|nr:pyocin knob domain-containing protein [Pseudoflavonifractor phocaeensis]MBM6725431.1 hypothetical protein [Pseudoflavonifractor phocaeensis]